MPKDFTGTYTTTQVLSSLKDNPATVTSTGIINVNTAGAVGLFAITYPWNVTNLGTVESLGSLSYGIDLVSGGSVANGPGGYSSALIEGTRFGIVITGAAGTVANYGTIESPGTFSYGVFLTAGGTVTNGSGGATSALIDGGTRGVAIVGDVGTVTNFGTIESTYGYGVFLEAGGSVTNGASGYSSALISGVTYGVAIDGTPATVTNYGTIEGTGSSGRGVFLDAGGSVTNGSSAVPDASITGAVGVDILGAAGTVTNYGTVAATSHGIYFDTGGTVTNSNLIGGGTDVVLVDGAEGTITNYGTILGTSGAAIWLNAGGTVTNSSTGLISGSGDVIFANNGYGTVVNDGVIENTGESGDGVCLDGGGSVANSGAIQGYDHGVEINAAAGTVTNSGTIQGTAGYGVGVALYGGGGVSNTVAAALVTGREFGVRILGGGSVSNDGTIEATGAIGDRIGYGIGVALADGGSVTNVAAGALISGISGGVYIGGAAAGTLANLGTVAASAGTGVFLHGGGSVTNGQPSATAALISGTNYGVRALYGATIANYGTIVASGEGISLGAGGSIANSGLISGGTDVVFADGSAGTIANSGTILGTGGAAIWLNAGGTVTNSSGGLIRGAGDIIFANYGLGTVVNDGTIDNTGVSGDGVCLDAGGSVANTGSIQGYDHGVEINSSGGAVTNSGNIAAVGDTGIGVYLTTAGSTVTNAGTIGGASGTAIAFSGGGNRLIVDPGAVFSGIVDGGIGGDTLELAAAAGGGTISGLGTQYLGFTAVTVNAGAGWALSGSNTLGAGVTLTDLGTLTNLGSLSGAGSLVVDPASLVNSGYIGMTVTLLGGGYLNNTTTGTISAAGAAVYGIGGAATIANAGTVTANGAGSSGVFLRGGGVVTNGQPGPATAAIFGIQYGIRAEGVPATVTNYGTISGDGRGVGLRAGGSVTNAVGGMISGTSSSVYFTGAAGTVANHGLIAVSGTYGTGVQLNAGGTVANSGTIASTGKHGIAVYLTTGSVTNTGLISAVAYNDVAFGVVVAGPAGNVVNAGMVEGASEGVWLEGGGTVTNSGSIAGTGIGGGGVRFGDQSGIVGAAGTVLNSGTITGNVRGVFLDGGGAVSNGTSGAPGGLIQGNLRGVASYLSAATLTNFGTIAATAVNGIGIDFAVSGSTVTNAGTISGAGGTAAAFSGGGNRLIVDPGAVFSGVVDAGVAAGDVLELAAGAATGTIGGLGSSFTGFDSVAVDASAVWLLSGTNALGAGTTLSNAGTLEIGSALTLGGNVVNGGVIDIEAGIRLTLATAVTGAGSIAFIGSGGALEIDGTTMPANTIGGFAAGDSIDLPNIIANSISYAGGVVTLLNGTITVAQLSVATPYANPGFTENPDNTGGTLITVAPLPPAPSGLALSPLSDSGVVGDNLTNVAAPSITGTGEAGDTVRLFDGSTLVGSSTVGAGGAWAVTASGLSPGAHVLSATESDGAGNVSAPSAGLSITIDQSAPVTGAVSLTVASGSLPTPLGIAAPSDSDNPAGSLGVTVGQLPTNGSVTLADGITAVSPGEVLSIAQLTGLKFTPASNQIGASSSFTYTVTDPAGNSSTGSATATIAPPVATSVFDFVFTYADGKDYYLGTVADNGGFGYRAGQQITTGAGRYDIFNKEGPATLAPSGTVVVSNYSHGGPGAASTLPVDTAAGRPDGTGGLGSESDAVLGIDGQAHRFSSTQEANFGAATALFGFVYSYSDGAAFYSGSVADDGRFGLSGGPDAAFDRTIIDSTGTVVGTYSIFRNGVSTLAPGSVVIDRFTTGDASFVTNHAGLGAVDGSTGLGSEVGRITVAGVGVGFSADLEPRLTLSIATVPASPTVAPADVITAEVTQLYQEVLGRNPDPGGLATFSAELAGGASLATVRQQFAASPEAQNDLNALYRQVLGRDADPGGLATYTGLLAGGSSLAAVQLILAQSPEAQNDIAGLYQDLLGRAPDGGGLITFVAALAGGTSLAAVRGMFAHSPEAANDLIQLFQGILGRPPGAAELVGMEDLLAGGATQQTLQSALQANRSAGGFATVTAAIGNAALTAPPLTPTLFVFGDIAFGNDTIAGFDPTRDTIQIAHARVADLAALAGDTAAFGAGTLITINPSQSIQLTGIPPGKLGPANFQIL